MAVPHWVHYLAESLAQRIDVSPRPGYRARDAGQYVGIPAESYSPSRFLC